MEIYKFKKKNDTYITLQKASEISSYTSDYIGRLARKKKIRAKKIYTQYSWAINRNDIIPGNDFELIPKNVEKKDKKNVPEFLTLKEASRISGYNFDHLGRLAREGKIRAKQIFVSPAWQVHKKDLLRYSSTKKAKFSTKLHYIFVTPYNKDIENEVEFQKRITTENNLQRPLGLIPHSVIHISKKAKIIHTVVMSSRYGAITILIIGIFLFGGIFKSIAVQFNTKNIEIFPTKYEITSTHESTKLEESDNDELHSDTKHIEWINPKNILTRDLNPDTLIIDFNQQNSTSTVAIPANEHPITQGLYDQDNHELVTPGIWAAIEYLFKSETKARSNEPTSLLYRIENLFGLRGAKAQEDETNSGTETITELPNIDGESTESPEDENSLDPSHSNQDTQQASDEQSVVYDVDNANEAQITETIYPYSKSITVSGFSSKPLLEEIKLKQESSIGIVDTNTALSISDLFLKMSFASLPAPQRDGSILIEWSTNSATSSQSGQTWRQITQITQNTYYSNDLNNGYFSFPMDSLFGDLQGKVTPNDIDNLNIKVTALSNTPEFTPAYIDAIWLDVEYVTENINDKRPKVKLKKGFNIRADKTNYNIDEIPQITLTNPSFTINDLKQLEGMGEIEVIEDKGRRLSNGNIVIEQITENIDGSDPAIAEPSAELEPVGYVSPFENSAWLEPEGYVSPFNLLKNAIGELIESSSTLSREDDEQAEQELEEEVVTTAPGGDHRQKAVTGDSIQSTEPEEPTIQNPIGELKKVNSEQVTGKNQDEINPIGTLKPVSILQKAFNFLAPATAQAQREAKAQNTISSSVTAYLVDIKGNRIKTQASIQRRFIGTQEEYSIQLQKPNRYFRPGKYTAQIELETPEAILVFEQDFTWGVLAINFNKSIYTTNKPDITGNKIEATAGSGLVIDERTGDTQAYIQMGVIDDFGHTLCNAELELKISSPSLKIERFTTSEGTVLSSQFCKGDSFNPEPDYSVFYTFPLNTDELPQLGTYDIELTATTKNGTRSITDSFEVRELTYTTDSRQQITNDEEQQGIVSSIQNNQGDVSTNVSTNVSTSNQPVITEQSLASVPFDIERHGPTRVFPIEPYDMSLTIIANQDFEGSIVETVPDGFKILQPDSQQLPAVGQEGTEQSDEVIPESSSLDTLYSILNTPGPYKQIIWKDISLKQGEQIELSYTFDAPDTSPQFYLLGPLELHGTYNMEHETGGVAQASNNNGSLGDVFQVSSFKFKELRQWQIASDATLTTLRPGEGTITGSGDGTDTTDMLNQAATACTAAVCADSIDEVTHDSDTTYVLNKGTTDMAQFFELTDMPSDFVSMDDINIDVA